jgi:hypothetical protein
MGILSKVAKVGIGAGIGFATGGPIGAIAGGGQAGLSAIAGSKTKKAAKEQQRLQRIQQRRNAILQVREARAQRASAQQGAANLGAGQSSAAEGGGGSVVSQLGANLEFISTYGASTERSSSLLNKASTFSNLSQITDSLVGQYTEAQKIFKTAKAADPTVSRSDVNTGTIFDLIS